MNILLTGGTGYIGSHTAVVMGQSGHNIVLLDNLSNSSKVVVGYLERIIGKEIVFIEGDVRNTELLAQTMKRYQIEAVIHFAGLKAVGESVSDPILYFSNNVQGSISLLQAMKQENIKTIIFSSSATVYGVPEYSPCDEFHPTRPISPYGDTKLQIEIILRDLVYSDPQWRIACLRYFNPVGAHESGLIGDDPNGNPANLVPYIAKVANGIFEYVNIHGDDYQTRDGTGERDYIHVMDLADGHLAAVHYLRENTGIVTINLGTGKSTTVYECIKAFERASGKLISLKIAPRRPGDIPVCYASADLAKQNFGWTAKRTLDEMCASAWYFEQSRSELSSS